MCSGDSKENKLSKNLESPMSEVKPPDATRVAILDLLRFVAALLVLCYHYHYYLLKVAGDNTFSAFKFGYLGVNFFFMLSGFVIMASAHNRSAIKFGLLRALRLYPAFIICLLITLLVLYGFGSTLPPVSSIVLNGLILNDYFGVPNIDGVYWTLQAELKFYGCVFLLILCGVLTQHRIWLSIWLLLSISFHFYSQPFFLGWLISPAYSFFFISGVAAYILFKQPRDTYALSIFFIAMIFSSLKAWDQIAGFCRDYTSNDQVVAVLLTSIFFLFFYFLPGINKRFSPGKWVSVLGGMSYPLYLIHSRAGLEFVKNIQGVVGPYWALVIGGVTVLLVALLIHLYIERPIFKRARVLVK